MTRRDIDASLAQGRPRYFYHFFRKTEDWFYTSFRTPVAYWGHTYEPLEITHGEIESGGEDRPGSVDITFPTDSVLGLILQEGSAPTQISVQISLSYEDVLDDPAIIFNGELRGTSITDDQCVVSAVLLQSRMSMAMPRGLWQRQQCIWNTYTPGRCGVNPAAFTHSGLVTDIDGLVVSVAGTAAFNPDPAFFALGVMTKGERKGMIERQDGDDLILQHTMHGLIVGDTVSLLAGEDRTKETCLNKFNNIARHFAFSEMPIENPHYGQGLRP